MSESEVLSGILEVASEGIIVADADRKIAFFSKGAEIIFGYAEKEMIGRRIECLMPHRFRARHRHHVDGFSSGARASIVMAERGRLIGLRKTGEEFPLEASLSRQVTTDGVIFTTIVRDISDRLRAEQTLRNSEHRLRVALNTAGAFVFEVDLETGKVTMDGLDGAPWMKSELIAKGWASIHPNDRRAARAAWLHHVHTGSTFRIVARLNREAEVWVRLTAELVDDADDLPLRVVGAIQDVTPEQRARQAAMQAAAASEAANAAKSAFLATMSHEIRTPLNGVLGMVQVMAADHPTERQARQLEVIRSSGESLLAILNDVLDFSKIEAGKLDLEDIEFDLAKVLSGVEASFSAVAAHKGLALMWDSAKADGRYRGDPVRLRQILCNLVSNALKFTSSGEVRMSAVYDGGLRLEVADTGIGIAPDTLQKLFAPFVQADAGMCREYGGTGLGLSIAKRLAELMGGSIGASSVLGAGSRFQVTLPLQRLGAGAATAKPVRQEPQKTQFEGFNILLAEDNPTNQLVISTLLQQVGCEVSVASNGAEAVEARRSGAFDLILMDVQMPGMDGPSATRFIRAEEVATGKPPIPIVGLTANAMAHQIAEYEASGMDQVVTKPIVLSHLLEAIQGCVAATSAVTAKSVRRGRTWEIKAPGRG